MKNKRTVPFYQYITSFLCVAFLAGGSGYIYLGHRVKKMSQEGAAASYTHFRAYETQLL